MHCVVACGVALGSPGTVDLPCGCMTCVGSTPNGDGSGPAYWVAP